MRWVPFEAIHDETISQLDSLRPIPVPPPVTTAVNPETSNSFEAFSSSLVFLPVAMVRIGRLGRERIDARKEVGSRL